MSPSSIVAAVCPGSPMCSRSGAPAGLRMRYCSSLVARLVSYLSPFSFSLSSSSREGAGAGVRELPYYQDAELRGYVLAEAERLLRGSLIGQSHVTEPLLNALRRKLLYPNEPLVLHLAGDNGVGKTLTARLLSQALSLRCTPGRDLCDSGDALLSISGTSFDGMGVEAVRRAIVGRVMEHMERYPHGVVLIDDFTAMDPALVPVLAPLLGRAPHYPEQFMSSSGSSSGSGGGDAGGKGPHTHPARAAPHERKSRKGPPPPLSQLLVIITTDLGQQGRTVGKSHGDIEQLVRDTFADLYGSLLPSYTRTFAYLPFDAAVAAAVVRSAVDNLPCTLGVHAAAVDGGSSGGGMGGLRAALFGSAPAGNAAHRCVAVTASAIDDVAVRFLVERHRRAWEGKENGHALRRIIEDELVPQILAYQERRGLDHRIVARFRLDPARAAVVLDVHEEGDRSAMWTQGGKDEEDGDQQDL